MCNVNVIQCVIVFCNYYLQIEILELLRFVININSSNGDNVIIIDKIKKYNFKYKEATKIVIQSNKIKLTVNRSNINKIIAMMLLILFGFHIPNSLSLLSTSHSLHNNKFITTNTYHDSTSSNTTYNNTSTTLSNHNNQIFLLAHSSNHPKLTTTILYSSGKHAYIYVYICI